MKRSYQPMARKWREIQIKIRLNKFGRVAVRSMSNRKTYFQVSVARGACVSRDRLYFWSVTKLNWKDETRAGTWRWLPLALTTSASKRHRPAKKSEKSRVQFGLTWSGRARARCVAAAGIISHEITAFRRVRWELLPEGPTRKKDWFARVRQSPLYSTPTCFCWTRCHCKIVH